MKGYFGLICFLCVVLKVFGAAPIAGFRPPAVPLIVQDPYMNVSIKQISPNENRFGLWRIISPMTGQSKVLEKVNTFRYWDGTIKALVGLIRIDGGN
jgi:hypothetical protein